MVQFSLPQIGTHTGAYQPFRCHGPRRVPPDPAEAARAAGGCLVRGAVGPSRPAWVEACRRRRVVAARPGALRRRRRGQPNRGKIKNKLLPPVPIRHAPRRRIIEAPVRLRLDVVEDVALFA